MARRHFVVVGRHDGDVRELFGTELETLLAMCLEVTRVRVLDPWARRLKSPTSPVVKSLSSVLDSS